RDVAASSAVHVDRIRFLQEPHAHLETEVRRRECADRADVHGVERIIVVENAIRMTRDRAERPAIHNSKHVILSDFLHEANAARAKNTTLRIERNARSKLDGLRLLHFSLQESRTRVSVLDGEFLQLALAGLVADGTIER